MAEKHNQELVVAAASELLKRRNGRKNLIDFISYTKKNYKINWHHKLICDTLDRVIAGELRRVIICVPVRHGKSEIASRNFPAFLLGRNPDLRIIATSYSANLASRMNRDAQRVIESPQYKRLFPDTKLASSVQKISDKGHASQNATMFEIVGHEGYYISAGIRGSITGSGFDIGIIDDPFKNREEAESETIRDRVWEWYTDVFRSREEGNGAIIITCTRWHEDDLVGRLLAKAKEDPNADQWTVITLPALSEDSIAEYDQRTEPGVALWRGKYDEEYLLRTRATIPVYSWLSLYQQRPSSASGNLFKRDNFRYFKESGSNFQLIRDKGNIETVQRSKCIVFQTCDPAGTAKSSSDYFVLTTFALTPRNDLLVLDVFRTKLEGPDQVDFISREYQKWNPVVIGFESIGIGKTTYQNLKRTEMRVYDQKSSSDKFTRALSAAIRLNTHTVFFRSGATWLKEFEEEMLKFPNVKHDDQVDTVSMADAMVSNEIVINYEFNDAVTEVDLGYNYPISQERTYGDAGLPSW